MTNRSSANNLLNLMRKAYRKVTDNRMRMHDPLTPSERAALDREFAKNIRIVARISSLKTTPVTPNPIFV